MSVAQQMSGIRPVKVQIGSWSGAGWEWFLSKFWINTVVGVIASVLLSLAILTGPLFVGFANLGLKKVETGRTELGFFFDGFASKFLHALLASILIFVFSIVGFVFFIVPGLVILAMYMFTFHFMIDRDLDFWEAMEASRKLVAHDYLGFVLFGVLLAAINLIGVMLMGIGVIFTLPITGYALTAAYLDCVGGKAIPAPASGPIRID